MVIFCAALATIIAQYISGLGITVFALRCCPQVIPKKSELKWNGGILKEIVNLSSMTCIQQAVMNFGILMVQGLVNSFGPVVMAAFAAAVKIDSFAYMPVQDFGNAFSTYVAQNYGAGQTARIRKGIDVAACDGRVVIDMHVIVEQGVNMASVVRNLTSSVTHLIKQIAELQSVDVKVHIEGLRASR